MGVPEENHALLPENEPPGSSNPSGGAILDEINRGFGTKSQLTNPLNDPTPNKGILWDRDKYAVKQFTITL